jgi:hypothetical protein
LRTLLHTFYHASRSDVFALYHLTDVHLGHAAADEKQFAADIQAIADNPNARWGGGGDYIDAIARVGDPRYRESTLAPWLRSKNDPIGHQVRRFVDMVAPIAGKCLYLLKGNHEDAVLTHNDRDVYQEIVRGVADAAGKEMRDLALGWEGFVSLKFRRGSAESFGSTRQIMIYTHHGAGGGRKQGGHAGHMEDVLLTYECDLALLGHRHIRQIVNKARIESYGKGARLKERVGVWCGSYLGPYIESDDDGMPVDNYPQMKHLPPLSPGIVPILIYPDKRRIMPVVTNGNAADLLLSVPTPKPAEAA